MRSLKILPHSRSIWSGPSSAPTPSRIRYPRSHEPTVSPSISTCACATRCTNARIRPPFNVFAHQHNASRGPKALRAPAAPAVGHFGDVALSVQVAVARKCGLGSSCRLLWLGRLGGDAWGSSATCPDCDCGERESGSPLPLLDGGETFATKSRTDNAASPRCHRSRRGDAIPDLAAGTSRRV